MSINLIEEARASLKDEVFSATVYGRLSKLFRGSSVSSKLSEYARMEADHASFWKKFIEDRDHDIGHPNPSKGKVSLYIFMFRLLGAGLTIRMLERGERNAISEYSAILGSPEVTEEEKIRIRRMLEDELDHESGFEEAESRFKYFLSHVGSAVSSISYGLVQAISVSAGLAGVYGESTRVAVGGMMIGLAGSISITVGAYTSGRAQMQVRVGLLSRIRAAAEQAPHVFANRIRRYMTGKDMSEETANIIAVEASEKRELLTRIVAEEEYGLREEALGEPLRDSLYSGMFYLLGAILPLAPYLFGATLMIAIPLSLIIVAAMLGLMGLITAISANLEINAKASELIALGIGSAAAIYLIGRLASTLI